MSKDGQFTVDFDDELVAGVVITHEGTVVHPALSRADSQADAAPPPAESPTVE
jgi:hypothetical protein